MMQLDYRYKNDIEMCWGFFPPQLNVNKTPIPETAQKPLI